MKNLFYREVPSQFRTNGNRSVELSFSSEAPVERWYGKEILLHGQENVDLSRLKSVGALIYGHDPSDLKNILGKIDRAWIEDRRGRADIIMDDDVSGNEALVKIKSGSLTGVSVGYMIHKAQKIEEGGRWTDPDGGQTYEGPALIATRWEPMELTLTPIPADASVGVGRTLTRSLEGIQIINQTRHTERSTTMGNLARSISKKIEGGMQDSKVKSGLIGLAIDNCESAGDHKGAEAIRSMQADGLSYEEISSFYWDRFKGQKKGTTSSVCRTFRDVTDDEFFAGLSNPAQHSLDEPVGNRGTRGAQTEKNSTVRSFKQIEDADFFAGLCNPAGRTL